VFSYRGNARHLGLSALTAGRGSGDRYAQVTIKATQPPKPKPPPPRPPRLKRSFSLSSRQIAAFCRFKEPLEEFPGCRRNKTSVGTIHDQLWANSGRIEADLERQSFAAFDRNARQCKHFGLSSLPNNTAHARRSTTHRDQRS
jgi:hypothetical protein